jgi:sugar O-acyltransferase (sialic acid O-acetyltransferase NeuD family)
MEKILLIGAGALARDIVGLFGSHTFVAAYVDPEFSTDSFTELPVTTSWNMASEAATHYIIAVSDIAHRTAAISAARRAGLKPASALLAPSAIIAADAIISSGCVIGHFVVVGPNARIGENVLVMHNANVAHDSSIGENTVVSAGVKISGNVEVGRDCFIGPNAALIPEIRIGANSLIGAGAACFKNANANSILMGNPAREIAKLE